MRRSATLFVALALFGTSTAEGSSTEDKKKAIRMKSTPKLKEILTGESSHGCRARSGQPLCALGLMTRS